MFYGVHRDGDCDLRRILFKGMSSSPPLSDPCSDALFCWVCVVSWVSRVSWVCCVCCVCCVCWVSCDAEAPWVLGPGVLSTKSIDTYRDPKSSDKPLIWAISPSLFVRSPLHNGQRNLFSAAHLLTHATSPTNC